MIFLERNELYIDLGKTLDRLHIFMQEISGFSYTKL